MILKMKSIKYQVDEKDLHLLTREVAINKIRGYGFVEIRDALKFLQGMCDLVLDRGDLTYLRGKIDVCLRHHDNGSNYFISLREFASELDCFIYLKP